MRTERRARRGNEKRRTARAARSLCCMREIQDSARETENGFSSVWYFQYPRRYRVSRVMTRRVLHSFQQILALHRVTAARRMKYRAPFYPAVVSRSGSRLNSVNLNAHACGNNSVGVLTARNSTGALNLPPLDAPESGALSFVIAVGARAHDRAVLQR